MKITKYAHSFIVVEKEGQRLIIDPGSFSFKDENVSSETFLDVVGILITHSHKDHYDAVAINKILKNNPRAKVFTNLETKKVLELEDVSSETFESGEMDLGVFHVKAIPSAHEPILFSVPQHTAFVVDGIFLHPGDSIDPNLFSQKVPVAAIPIDGPWQTSVHALEFALTLGVTHIVPIHDGHLKDFFNQGMYSSWQKVCAERGIEFHPMLKPGDSFEIS